MDWANDQCEISWSYVLSAWTLAATVHRDADPNACRMACVVRAAAARTQRALLFGPAVPRSVRVSRPYLIQLVKPADTRRVTLRNSFGRESARARVCSFYLRPNASGRSLVSCSHLVADTDPPITKHAIWRRNLKTTRQTMQRRTLRLSESRENRFAYRMNN